jgi:YHS domain-containing protein
MREKGKTGKKTEGKSEGKKKDAGERGLKLPSAPAVKSHLEKEERRVCAYCGKPFEKGELTIEKEVHGRRWRFCSEQCYQDFMDAVHFRDQDLDGYKQEGNITVGEKEDEDL